MTETGGAGAGPRPGWAVALSFAGAQRDYVEQVAAALKAQGIRCFYDAHEQADLWGKYLAEELPTIYGEQAAAVVMFVSAEYVAGEWTRLEWRVALGRAVRERREYVLPARFDDTPLPGLLPDMVWVDLRVRTPQQFAAMIAAKLAALADAVPPDGVAGPGGPVDSSKPGTWGSATRRDIAPGNPLAGGLSRRRLLSCALTVTSLAAVAVGFAVYNTMADPPVRHRHDPRPRHKVKPSTFTLSGTLTLEPSSYGRIARTPQGCQGGSYFTDLTAGTAVIVEDPEGRQVAVGALQAGKLARGNSNWCVMTFSVPDVPRGLLSYSVTISHRGTQVITPQKAQAGVALKIVGP